MHNPPHLCYQRLGLLATLLPYSFVGLTPGHIQLVPGGPDAVGFVVSLN